MAIRIRTLTWKTVREELKTQSDIELIVQAVELRKLIYIVKGRFGTKDPLLLELIYRELERRGFKIRVKERLGIAKKK